MPCETSEQMSGGHVWRSGMRGTTSAGNKEIADQPKAKEAAAKEWTRLWDKCVWDATTVREWADVAAEARKRNVDVRMGRLFGIMVEKAAELPAGDPRRKYKHRVLFQGNQAVA